MPSMASAYERSGPGIAGQRRVIAGVAVFLAGVAALVAAIALATTPLPDRLDLGVYEARRYAGLLAGVGVPAIFAGVVTVLPTGRRDRQRAVIGVSIALVGVAFFWSVYPDAWLDRGVWYNAPAVAAVYALGGFLGLWSVLAALANYRRRNDPSGTVTLEVTRAGETHTVEVSRDELQRRDVSDLVGGLSGD